MGQNIAVINDVDQKESEKVSYPEQEQALYVSLEVKQLPLLDNIQRFFSLWLDFLDHTHNDDTPDHNSELYKIDCVPYFHDVIDSLDNRESNILQAKGYKIEGFGNNGPYK